MEIRACFMFSKMYTRFISAICQYFQAMLKFLSYMMSAAGPDPAVPSDDENALRLTDLNDDCLTEILEYLTNVNDLCAVADTCSRLNFLAYQIYQRRHTKQCLKFEPIMVKQRSNAQTHILRYLRNFGELLDRIEFTLTDDVEWQQTSQVNYTQAKWNDEVFREIVINCADTLQSLAMRGIALSLPRTPPGQAIFCDLKKLKLDYCIDLKCYEYASQLRVDWYFNKAYMFVRHLANTDVLERLEINQMLLTKEFLMILCECRNLKVLKLNAIRDDRFCSEIAFAEWLENLKQIVELELVVEYFDADAPDSVTVFMKHLGSAHKVEQLNISGGVADQRFVQALARFQCLKKLTIGKFTNLKCEHLRVLDNLDNVEEFTMTTWNELTPDDLPAIISKMGNLNKLRLHMSEYEEIDEQTFVALATIYRSRHRQLLVEHTESVLSWNINPDVFQEHARYLCFHEIYL